MDEKHQQELDAQNRGAWNEVDIDEKPAEISVWKFFNGNFSYVIVKLQILCVVTLLHNNIYLKLQGWKLI